MGFKNSQSVKRETMDHHFVSKTDNGSRVTPRITSVFQELTKDQEVDHGSTVCFKSSQRVKRETMNHQKIHTSYCFVDQQKGVADQP